MDSYIDPKFEVGPYERVTMTIHALEHGEENFSCTVPRPDNKKIPYPIHIKCDIPVKTYRVVAEIARNAYFPGARTIEGPNGQITSEVIKKRRYTVEIENDIYNTAQSSTQHIGGKHGNTKKVD